MDHAFAVRVLTQFLENVEEHLEGLDQGVQYRESPQYLLLEEVRARLIESAYVQDLGAYETTADERDRWSRARHAAIEALGRAQSAEEMASFLRPASPALAANDLHPWVWEPAAQLWAAEAHQDAVLAAARTVNRRLQQKLDRHDVGETDLCMQSFDIKAPSAGKPRLRFGGDRDTPTWKARQDGAKYAAAGTFLAIRNLAAHADEVNWTKQEALEYLAYFSVVSRWIDECTVEDAPNVAGIDGA
ncbi:TIGR02391 family protein [Streptomyces sp. MBT49]|uniref:TIGR02391 family protein n=1 Tax=Streptomyces sp. MBT49 TaxID=1488380 RepID=UPI00190CF30F|nr:TIGR02391 family protein [Streptomyces sp. MBT49]MBK3627021.1 TIGR02391 family protein [Streptomyces sp. MBT49]